MNVENIRIESPGAGEKTWSVVVDADDIKVENNNSTTKLFVNDKLQDVYFAIIGNQKLTGKLSNGKEIKVAIGNTFKLKCCIFVDNELVLED